MSDCIKFTLLKTKQLVALVSNKSDFPNPELCNVQDSASMDCIRYALIGVPHRKRLGASHNNF